MEININVLLLYRNENYTFETIIGKFECIRDILYTVRIKNRIYYKIKDINFKDYYGDININEYIKYRRKYKLKKIDEQY